MVMMKNTVKVTTTYNETGRLLSQFDNVCEVQIGCEVRHIHATKVFVTGKSLQK